MSMELDPTQSGGGEPVGSDTSEGVINPGLEVFDTDPQGGDDE